MRYLTFFVLLNLFISVKFYAVSDPVKALIETCKHLGTISTSGWKEVERAEAVNKYVAKNRNLPQNESELAELEAKYNSQLAKLLNRSVRNGQMPQMKSEKFADTIQWVDSVETYLSPTEIGYADRIANAYWFNERSPNLPSLYTSVPFVGHMLPKDKLSDIENLGLHYHQSRKVTDYNKMEELQRKIFAIQNIRKIYKTQASSWDNNR